MPSARKGRSTCVRLGAAGSVSPRPTAGIGGSSRGPQAQRCPSAETLDSCLLQHPDRVPSGPAQHRGQPQRATGRSPSTAPSLRGPCIQLVRRPLEGGAHRRPPRNPTGGPSAATAAPGRQKGDARSQPRPGRDPAGDGVVPPQSRAGLSRAEQKRGQAPSRNSLAFQRGSRTPRSGKHALPLRAHFRQVLKATAAVPARGGVGRKT